MHRRNVHAYLVMDLHYRKNGTVKFSIIRYLDIVLQEILEHLGVTAAIPAAEHPLKVHNERKTQ